MEKHALFVNTKGEKANFADVDLRYANFKGANFEGVDFEGVDFTYANFEGANFKGANLRHAIFRHANLRRANLESANLTYASLEGANLEDANLEGAKLTEAKLEGANLEGANLKDASLKKTPISYYGGKQNMVKTILPFLETPHAQYVEPFCGGLAVFFAKKPSSHEVINDIDNRVINFWKQCQTNFEPLQEKIKMTLHSEYYYKKAGDILRGGLENSTPLDFAWAFWVQTNMSFSAKIYGGFAFGNDNTRPLNTKNKRRNFIQAIEKRLGKTQIFCRDAIELIKLKDTPDTFFYFDPPYAESQCGHYESEKSVYYQLLELLPTLKGKFLLSSYPSSELNELRNRYGFLFQDTVKSLSVDSRRNAGKTKTECLTFNFQLPKKQYELF